MFSRVLRLRSPLVTTGLVVAAAGGCNIVYETFKPSPIDKTARNLTSRDQNGDIIIPRIPSFKTRQAHIEDLKLHASNGESYDILVIGGGATGTGIALDAASRALKVAIIEEDDFSSGASSKSTKLVHGGVRYLEKAVWNLDYSQLQLVLEALQERRTFLQVAPHLSQSLPILLPLHRWWQIPYFWVGTKAYDLLAGSNGLQGSSFLSRNAALKAFPLLRQENLVGAFVYYDGQHNDSRMNIALAVTAALYGATVVNYMKATKIHKDSQGKICGVQVREMLPQDNYIENSSKEFVIRAKVVINATGPFTDMVERLDDPTRPPMIAPSSGAHIVLPEYMSPKGMGILDPATSDGRVIFLLPWQGRSLAGTTDQPSSIVNREPAAREDEIEFILKEVRKILAPEVKLSRSDVLASWSGIRPLVRDHKTTATESLVRGHLVTISPSGLLTCTGGKWTTYRQMARETVDTAIEAFQLSPANENIPSYDKVATTPTTIKCRTAEILLVGAEGYSDQLHMSLVERLGVSFDIAQHLASNYGDRAWEVIRLSSPSDTAARLSPSMPFVDGEILYGILHEYAQTATDILARRTRLAFLEVNTALEALPRIVDIMAKELQWSKTRKEQEWIRTVDFLQSMGLPSEHARITREDVINRKHRVPVSNQETIPPTATKVGVEDIGAISENLEPSTQT